MERHHVLLIRDVNGVPLAAVIRKRLIPPPDNEDMAFGLRHSKYKSHDDKMIEHAPILDRKEYEFHGDGWIGLD